MRMDRQAADRDAAMQTHLVSQKTMIKEQFESLEKALQNEKTGADRQASYRKKRDQVEFRKPIEKHGIQEQTSAGKEEVASYLDTMKANTNKHGCWTIIWTTDHWLDWIVERYRSPGEGISFVLVGANLGCPSTASMVQGYIPSVDDCEDPLWRYAMKNPLLKQVGVVVEPVANEMNIVKKGWSLAQNKRVSFFSGVASIDCEHVALIRPLQRPPSGTCCPANKTVTFQAPSVSARIERNGSHAQYVNQIGSLLGDQTIKHILKKESDVDSIPVKCSTVHDIVEGSHLDIEDVDVLYVDVEGFEFWVLADALKRRPLKLRPKMIIYEHKVLFGLKGDLDKGLQALLASAGYFLGVQDSTNSRAIRLDVVVDSLVKCGKVQEKNKG